MNRKPPEECTEPDVCAANQRCEHDCTYQRIMRVAKAGAGARKAPDPRDPRPEAEMAGRDGMFRDHNCYRCKDGERACVRGNPRQCEFPHARND
jgi:hypothetical protein